MYINLQINDNFIISFGERIHCLERLQKNLANWGKIITRTKDEFLTHSLYSNKFQKNKE